MATSWRSSSVVKRASRIGPMVVGASRSAAWRTGGTVSSA